MGGSLTVGSFRNFFVFSHTVISLFSIVCSAPPPYSLRDRKEKGKKKKGKSARGGAAGPSSTASASADVSDSGGEPVTLTEEESWAIVHRALKVRRVRQYFEDVLGSLPGLD